VKPKTMTVQDTVNPDLKRKIEKFRPLAEAEFRRAIEAILVTAKDLAGKRLKRPGTYLQQFFYEFQIEGNSLVFIFGNRHPWAAAIEKGTKPHRIPREGYRTMVFFKEGEWKFREKVFHPGTKPTWIIRDAVAQNLPLLHQAAQSLGAKL